MVLFPGNCVSFLCLLGRALAGSWNCWVETQSQLSFYPLFWGKVMCPHFPAPGMGLKIITTSDLSPLLGRVWMHGEMSARAI